MRRKLGTKSSKFDQIWHPVKYAETLLGPIKFPVKRPDTLFLISSGGLAGLLCVPFEPFLECFPCKRAKSCFSKSFCRLGQESHLLEIPFSTHFACFGIWAHNPFCSKSHLLANLLYISPPQAGKFDDFEVKPHLKIAFLKIFDVKKHFFFACGGPSWSI